MIKIECETEAQARRIEARAGGVVHFARRSWWVVLAALSPAEYRAQVPAHVRRGTVCHRVSDNVSRSRQLVTP